MNGSTSPGTDYKTTLYDKWKKYKELALRVFDGHRTMSAASGTSPIATRTPYQYAAGMLLKSNMPATMRRACSLPTAMRGGSSPKAPEPDSSR